MILTQVLLLLLFLEHFPQEVLLLKQVLIRQQPRNTEQFLNLQELLQFPLFLSLDALAILVVILVLFDFVTDFLAPFILSLAPHLHELFQSFIPSVLLHISDATSIPAMVVSNQIHSYTHICPRVHILIPFFRNQLPHLQSVLIH